MKLKKRTIEELGNILADDYHTSLNEADLEILGIKLLRLTRIATATFARVDERIVHSSKRSYSLEPKTSKE